MTKRCGFLLRFFEESKYRQQFLEGNLHTNSLEYYRNNEAQYGKGRGDKSEGIVRAENSNVIINSIKHNGVTVNMAFEGLSNTHVFCMTVIEEEWLERIDDKRVQVKIPQEVIDTFKEEYGSYVCLVPIEPFIEQLKKYADNEMYKRSICYGRVTYSNIKDNRSERMGQADNGTILFNKDNAFSREHEFRVTFNNVQDKESVTVKLDNSIEVVEQVVTIDDLIEYFKHTLFRKNES